MPPSPALSLCFACGPGIVACRRNRPCDRAFVTYHSKSAYEKAKQLYYRRRKKREAPEDVWPIVNKWLD